MSAFVLDASTAISWCFEEAQTPYSISVLDRIAEGEEVHVPSVWPLEVTNALVKAFRRRDISREEVFEYAHQLSSLPIIVESESPSRVFGDVLRLAERYQLTTYDASYLELAHRRGLPIATADTNLAQAAGAVQVHLVPGAR